MSINNIGFYEDLTKIILYSNEHPQHRFYEEISKIIP